MEKLHFNTTIAAPREKVWNVLWGNDTYTLWTAPFMEGSSAVTDWEEGSRVIFGDSTGNNGMISVIAAKRPNEYMSFKHLGMIKDGEEDTESPETKAWAGAMENYTLKEVNGQTELTIDIDVTDEHKAYFSESWPKALVKVKELSEKK